MLLGEREASEVRAHAHQSAENLRGRTMVTYNGRTLERTERAEFKDMATAELLESTADTQAKEIEEACLALEAALQALKVAEAEEQAEADRRPGSARCRGSRGGESNCGGLDEGAAPGSPLARGRAQRGAGFF